MDSLFVGQNYYEKNLLFFFTVYKNERKQNKFWRQKETTTKGFYKNKKPFPLVDIGVNKILVSKKEPYGTNNALKYFIGYSDNDVSLLLCLRLSKMTSYINKFMEKKLRKINPRKINLRKI